MAIYHLSTKPISRSSGRSATASIAYRAGIDITDERTGKTYDYTKRSGVVETQLHLPRDFLNRKLEGIDRRELWNLAEKTETRKNSRTAREIVINLPHELNQEQRSELANEFANSLADKYEIAVDVAIHEPDKEGDNRNHHAHLMLTTRNLERMENGTLALTEKSQLEMSNTQLKERNLPKAQDELKAIRKQWADMANEHLEKASISERIDHRSHVDRGLDVQPTIKMGWKATEMERKGTRTELGDINRAIKADNEIIKGLKTEIIIKSRQRAENQRKSEKHIEVPQKEEKAVREPIKSLDDRKKELKEVVSTFKDTVEKISYDIKKYEITELKKKQKGLIPIADKLRDELKQLKEKEPQKPLNPFKQGEYKEQHQVWRKEFNSKLLDYNELKKEHDTAQKEQKEAEKKGVWDYNSTAVELIRSQSPQAIERYNESLVELDDIQYQERVEKRQERSNDKGLER